MQTYRSAQWRAFRSEVISLDGGACVVCGRSRSDGVVLQVHHKRYLAGSKPWEYPHYLCETVCSGCHAAKHGIIPPKSDWEYVGWDDLEDLTGTCECCGTSIRYVFMIQHPNWRPMEVGEACCDNLTSSQVASGLMESKRRYNDRLKRFVASSRWMTLPGNVERITQKSREVEIVPKGREFYLRIERVIGKQPFPSPLDAKIKVFELIEAGVIDKWLERRQRNR